MIKNARIEGKTVKVKRQDVRIPLDFYDRLKQIAVERFNAPIHHRSNEPAITPTLLKLAELGIEYLESGLADKKTEITTTEVFKRLENLESSQPDNNTDNLLKELTSRIKTIENQLTDINTDTIPLRERLESLEERLNDSNTDTRTKELTARLEKVEQELADNNTDTIPNKSADVEPEITDNNTDKIKEASEQEEEINNANDLPPSSQLPANIDNNDDTNTDKSPDFYSGSNDPDPSSTEEDVANKQESLLDDEPILESSLSTATVEEKGLTDDELASLLGASPNMVKRWRLKQSKPRGNHSKRLKEWIVKGDRWFSKTTTT